MQLLVKVWQNLPTDTLIIKIFSLASNDDEIQILINQNSEIEHPEIKLLNMIGQQVEANAVKNDFNSFTISTESLASGSYWLLITDTKIRSTVKIIVIH